MPFKDPQAFLEWNRRYQQQRAAQTRVFTATLEGEILNLVKESPGQLDLRGLYEQLRPKGFPITAVQKAVGDLIQAGILRYLRPGEPGYPESALGKNRGPRPCWDPPLRLLVLTKPWRGSEGQECPRISTTMSNASLPDTKS